MTNDTISGLAPNEIEIDPLWLSQAVDQDNFSVFEISDDLNVYAAGKSLLSSAAFFWHSIDGQAGNSATVPDFSKLTPEALAPFKSQSMLLMLTPSGWIIRFVGEGLTDLMGGSFHPGMNLFELENSPICSSLIASLQVMQDKPSLYGFMAKDHDSQSYDALLMPLRKTEAAFDFVLCVVNQASAASNQIQESSTHESDGINHISSELSNLLDACRTAAQDIIKISSSSHDSLYETLATTLGFYETTLNAPNDLKALLAAQELTMQERAPFTPILKLVFGKDYDKTRLTEYAAALSYAWRQGRHGDNFVDFVKSIPGGIKGCVKQERIERQKQRGKFNANSFEEACNTLRGAKSHSLETIDCDQEFSLVIVRKDTDGNLKPITCYDASHTVLETAIKRTARQLSAGHKTARSQNPVEQSTYSQPAHTPIAGENQ